MTRRLILCDGRVFADATRSPHVSPGVQADRVQLIWRRPNSEDGCALHMTTSWWQGQTLHELIHQLPWSSAAVGELLLDPSLHPSARAALDWALNDTDTPDVGPAPDFRAVWLRQAAAVVC